MDQRAVFQRTITNTILGFIAGSVITSLCLIQAKLERITKAVELMAPKSIERVEVVK